MKKIIFFALFLCFGTNLLTSQTPTAQSDFTESITGASFEMKYIKGGNFEMGPKDSTDYYYKYRHTVYLSAFYMGKREVTVKEFRKFIDATKYKTDAESKGSSEVWNGDNWDTQSGVNWRHDEHGNRQRNDNHPVVHVSWNDAVAYCAWLTKTTEKIYRLPTEAEWEYAAKADSSYRYAGSDKLEDVAWYRGNSGGKTHPVGQKTANGFGLYDMTGNVWEWCSDWADGNYATHAQYNPSGPALGTVHVFRGSGCWTIAENCRLTFRHSGEPTYRNCVLGFRVVATVQ